MTRLAVALSFLLPCALLFGLAANAQPANTSDDASAVRTAVTDYSEGYFTGDAGRMEKTLHPHYLKHIIHGNIPMREKTGPQMVAEIRRNGPVELPAGQTREQVTVLDVAGDIASAKLVTPGWTDYMTLSKVDGQWKILSVVQKIED